MQALTAIGEVGIEFEGRSYLLRPSLFSMTRIGSPSEIIEAAGILLSPEPAQAHLLKLFRKRRFETALNVVYACAGDSDLTPLFGGIVPTGRGRLAYSPGAASMGEIVALARGLIRHGVVGDVDAAPADGSGEYISEFKAETYVSSAVAHLGLSEREAWNLTMTSYIKIVKAKFPPDPKAVKPKTALEVDATMARLKRINAARAGVKK